MEVIEIYYMANKLVLTGYDLMKGITLDKDNNNPLMYEAMPWQMVNLEDKTEEWKKWNADWFEYVGMQQVKEKRKRIIKNRMIAVGVLDMEDYQIGDTDRNFLNHFIADNDTPLKKFYPLIPPFIKVLKGEFLKRDLRVFVRCIDRETEDSKLQYKMDMVNQILIQDAMQKKQQALAKLGIQQIPEEDIQNMPPEQQEQALQMNQQFVQEMETAQKLAESEQKYKKYRHVMEEFGQLVLNKDRDRFNMDEMELDAFVESVCNEEIAFHLDMLESDYRIEIIDNATSFSHQSPNVKYYSEGDYFGWFEFMTVGEIINKFGQRLTEEDYKTLQNSIKDFTDSPFSGVGIIPDQFRNWQGAYYDATKPYPQGATDLNKYQYVQNEVINNFIKTNTNLTTDQIFDIFQNPQSFNNMKPKLFRVMRCYFRSQRKIGWLTKKDKSGMISFQGWIDENFKVTEEPIYDNSLTKEKSEETLVYGEHIEWTWTNEWRHICKINLNNDNPYWVKDTISKFKPIYIDGDPIKYNFTGKSDNPYEIHPPFEGVQWKMKGVRPVSIVEQLTPFQITTNIAFNRIPEIMFDDIGLALAINETTASKNLPGIESGGDPLEVAMENLRVNKVFSYNVDREVLRQQGNAAPIVPQVLNLSRIQEGVQYLNLAMQLKEAAGEVIGISRQRLAQSKASESATQTQAGINYSEVQTEQLFDRFTNQLMPRVYQKMIEAAVFYASISGEARAFYQTDIEGNAFLQIENLENTFKKYSIKCQSNSKEKELKTKLEQLFLNNNTTDTSMYELASGIAEASPSKILEKLREAMVKREEMAERQHQQQMQLQQQQEEAAKARQEQLYQQQVAMEQMKLESQERQTMMKVLGGIQTDANQDGQLDSFENLKLQIQQMQAGIQSKMGQDKLDFEKQKFSSDMDFKNRQLLSKESIEQKKLAAALANSQKGDDKELNRKIAKKQGVS